MEIKENHIRTFSALIVGLLIAIFGVYLFSGFTYRGNTISDLLQNSQGDNAVNKFFYGLYRLIGSGLEVSIYQSYSSDGNELATFFNSSLPVILTWIIAGLLAGFLIQGRKNGAILASIIFSIILVLWIFTGLIGGEGLNNLFIIGFLNTLSRLVTAFILIILGGFIGGLISGRFIEE